MTDQPQITLEEYVVQLAERVVALEGQMADKENQLQVAYSLINALEEEIDALRVSKTFRVFLDKRGGDITNLQNRRNFNIMLYGQTGDPLGTLAEMNQIMDDIAGSGLYKINDKVLEPVQTPKAQAEKAIGDGKPRNGSASTGGGKPVKPKVPPKPKSKAPIYTDDFKAWTAKDLAAALKKYTAQLELTETDNIPQAIWSVKVGNHQGSLILAFYNSKGQPAVINERTGGAQVYVAFGEADPFAKFPADLAEHMRYIAATKPNSFFMMNAIIELEQIPQEDGTWVTEFASVLEIKDWALLEAEAAK